uniref:Type II toxin-antitoxin system HicB family antitoxin n=1 Tax=Desulfatirhabdium butyrativorans TaxID=340467 RepID=A0A7C4MP91_9BACT
MYRFLVVIEKADSNYSAYSPDLPGCIATGKTRDQVARNMHTAIDMHVRGLLEDKLPVPQARSFAEYVVIHA